MNGSTCRKLLMGACLLLMAGAVMAQSSPVSWQYEAKAINGKEYQVRITAVLKDGWHLYSQQQPKESIAVPTQIKFTPHPLVSLDGKIAEEGKLVKHKEPELGIEAWQYSEKVGFVQLVKLKGSAKASLNGAITYQVCTDEKCLPAETIKFNVPLGE